jgi:hypothetical protein
MMDIFWTKRDEKVLLVYMVYIMMVCHESVSIVVMRISTQDHILDNSRHSLPVYCPVFYLVHFLWV